ncbi:hypothetical protein [Aquisalimonas sp.]|uniref:hypothetical protein n=1 Tax=Aquisalimonas sp. TaxID=1872621 RepID=UPI0025B8C6C4|nr:hypothetical protein [Aquisalimonas sp.]
MPAGYAIAVTPRGVTVSACSRRDGIARNVTPRELDELVEEMAQALTDALTRPTLVGTVEAAAAVGQHHPDCAPEYAQKNRNLSGQDHPRRHRQGAKARQTREAAG